MLNLKEKIKSVILSNLKGGNNKRIGVEVESLIYSRAGKRIPVNPGVDFSATELLNQIKKLSETDDPKPGYTLEPGGQLEWASPPVLSLHELNEVYLTHAERLDHICRDENLTKSDIALEPAQTPDTIGLIDMEKYHLMHSRFQTTGQHGSWMMKNTTSVQINVDFESESEAEEIAYIADCFQPFGSVLFANSPFIKNAPSGNKNLRYTIWNDTDAARCGSLLDHGITKPQGLLDKYIDYVMIVPAIFIQDESGDILPFQGTLGDWLRKKEKEQTLTAEDISCALHQIFTHVRFKNVIEIRGADRPPFGFELAPAAFWLGLTHEQKIREEALHIINGWTVADRRQFQIQAEFLDSFTNQNCPFKKTLDQVVDLALRGLDKRSESLNIQTERPFLEEYIKEITANGLPAVTRQKTI